MTQSNQNLNTILKQRLATGEIDENEYDRLRSIINEGSSETDEKTVATDNAGIFSQNKKIYFDKYGVKIDQDSVTIGNESVCLKNIKGMKVVTHTRYPFTEVAIGGFEKFFILSGLLYIYSVFIDKVPQIFFLYEIELYRPFFVKM